MVEQQKVSGSNFMISQAIAEVTGMTTRFVTNDLVDGFSGSKELTGHDYLEDLIDRANRRIFAFSEFLPLDRKTRFMSLAKRDSALSKLMKDPGNAFSPSLEGNIPRSTNSGKRVIALGAVLLKQAGLAEIKSLAEGRIFEKTWSEDVDLIRVLGTSRLWLQYNGISLMDLVNFSEESEITPIYDFLVAGGASIGTQSREPLFSQNKTVYPYTKDPEELKKLITTVGDMAISLFAVSALPPGIILRHTTKVEKEAAMAADQVVDNVRSYRQKVTRILQNPDHPEFKALADQIAFYLSQGEQLKFSAAYYSGVTDRFGAVALYRLAAEQARSGDSSNQDFFSQYAQAIYELVRDSDVALTRDNIPDFLNPTSPLPAVGMEIPEFSKLMSLATQSNLKCLLGMKSVDSARIDFSGHRIPKQVKVGVIDECPTIINFELQTSQKLNFNFDVSDNTFEWDFLEMLDETGDGYDMRPLVAHLVTIAPQIVLASLDQRTPPAFFKSALKGIDIPGKKRRKKGHLAKRVADKPEPELALKPNETDSPPPKRYFLRGSFDDDLTGAEYDTKSRKLIKRKLGRFLHHGVGEITVADNDDETIVIVHAGNPGFRIGLRLLESEDPNALKDPNTTTYEYVHVGPRRRFYEWLQARGLSLSSSKMSR